MKCFINDCSKLTTGNSKYCPEHAKIARQNWIAKINESKDARENKLAEFDTLFAKADKAGKLAASQRVPVPMVVQEHSNCLDDSSPVRQSWMVEGGVCGFAWIHIYPGNSPIANYAKKNWGAGSAYHGGVNIWVSDYGQSMTRKEAYAQAFAKTLYEAGYDKVYAMSRMD